MSITKIKIGTFEGVKEVVKLLEDKETQKQWGVSDQQMRDIKQVQKKLRQAEKKGKESVKQSAMREFYQAFGLNNDGTLKGTTSRDMFGLSSRRREKGEWVGGGVVYAKFPIKQTAPKFSGGSIDSLKALADNANAIKLEMDFFNVATRLFSQIMDTEYREWIENFLSAANFGDIDYMLLGALPWLLDNISMMSRAANWLSNRNIDFPLRDGIAITISNILNNTQDIPNDIKTFLTTFLNKLR